MNEKEKQNQNQNKNEGWICPKCGKVNAPWVSSCPCSDNGYLPFPVYPILPNPYSPYPQPIWIGWPPITYYSESVQYNHV